MTQGLVIPEWTLRPTVTQVLQVQAHGRRPTPVVARTGDVMTAVLVLAPQTVGDGVTAEVDRQTVDVVTWTLEVSVGTLDTGQWLHAEAARAVHVDDHWRVQPLDLVCEVVVT